MAGWIRSVKSELYKISHSALLPIHTLVPLVAMGVSLMYYRVSVWSATEKIYGYIQIVSAAFPFLIGIVCAVSAAQEQQAGSFQETLGFAGPRLRAHLSRLASLLVFGCFATLMAIVGFGLAFRAMAGFPLGWTVSLKIALLLFFASLPLYALHYFVAVAAGNGASVAAGLMGSLFSALLGTGLGDAIWTILPWGILARAGSLLLGAEFARTSIWEIPGVFQSAVFLTASIAVSVVFLILWGNKWEGRRNVEE